MSHRKLNDYEILEELLKDSDSHPDSDSDSVEESKSDEDEYIVQEEESSSDDEVSQSEGDEESEVISSNLEELPSQEEDLSSNTIRAKCGTVWKVISQADEDCGRFSQENIMRETPGPTSFAKRLVQKRSYMSTFSILIDDFIIEHIRKCTEAQGRRVLKNDNYKVSCEEILAVIGIMYARGILGKNQSIDHLWSRKWGPPFFRDTMPRHKFRANAVYKI
ncbi:uncharacterized protein LOC135226146 [Macrobrachium nipponense]|uniref:uncharacterized protein LOC135226146 n=1 Tax=Macrobrachium nipponense TaxID=159736 RepID=UPI0030C84F31